MNAETEVKEYIARISIPKEILRNLIGQTDRLQTDFIEVIRPSALHRNQTNLTDRFSEYNVLMLSKYCLLLDAALKLSKEGNYLSAQALNRSLFEIHAYEAYFMKNQTNLEKKISVRDAVNVAYPTNANEAYKFYGELCNVVHPDISPIPLYAASATIDSSEKHFKIKLDFMPNPDDASRKFFALGYLLVNATHMLELETHFLKDEIVCCGFDLAQLKLNLKNANEFRIKTVEPEFNRSRNAAKKLVFERLLDKLKKERLKQLAQQVGK